MARISLENIKKIDKARYTVHPKVLATYSTFDSYDDKFVQIDTYGKSEREMPDKISQSFQIDKETAIFLVKLLTEEFEITSNDL